MNNISKINNMTVLARKDGRYEGRVSIEGKRKSFYGKTKVEVKDKAKEFLKKVENGYKEPEKITLNEYIVYWLKTYKLNKIEPTSYSRLCSVYVNQIKDTIGSNMIGKITTKNIQELIDEYANPSNVKVKPLAMSGLKKIMELLRPCLNMAIREEVITKNPCEYVILPKQSCIKVTTKEQFSLSDEEIEQLKNSSLKRNKTNGEYKSRDALVLLLILNLGLRVGEALALEWEDIDFDKRIIYINKTVQSNIRDYDFESGKKKVYSRIKDSTKTSAGVRTLYLGDTTLAYINELKRYDERKGIRSKYVACTTVGTLNTARNLQRSLDKVLSRTNIDKKVSLHTLRHTFGSYLIRNGVGIEVISKLMGHANNSVTYNKYIHSIKEEEAKAMKLKSIIKCGQNVVNCK